VRAAQRSWKPHKHQNSLWKDLCRSVASVPYLGAITGSWPAAVRENTKQHHKQQKKNHKPNRFDSWKLCICSKLVIKALAAA
jgi:hypothetical protein